MSQPPWVPKVSRLVEVFHLAADLRPVVQDAAGAGDDGLGGSTLRPSDGRVIMIHSYRKISHQEAPSHSNRLVASIPMVHAKCPCSGEKSL